MQILQLILHRSFHFLISNFQICLFSLCLLHLIQVSNLIDFQVLLLSLQQLLRLASFSFNLSHRDLLRLFLPLLVLLFLHILEQLFAFLHSVLKLRVPMLCRIRYAHQLFLSLLIKCTSLLHELLL